MSRLGVIRTQVRPRSLIAVLAVVGAGAVVAACGNGGEKPTADYPAAADEVCLDTAGQLAAARKSEPESSSPADAAKQLEAQIPIRRDAVQQLQALRPPPELVAASGEYLTLAEKRIDALDQALTAANDKDEKAYLAAQQRFERLSDKLRATGEQAGLEACAEILPRAGQDDVLATVENLLTSKDSKKVCRELITERFAKDVYGSVKKCESRRGPPIVVSLALLDVGGIAATTAFVDVEVVDFFGSTKQQRIELVFDGDAWKVDRRTPLEEPASDDKPRQGDGRSGAAAGGEAASGETTTTADTTTDSETTPGKGSGKSP